MQLAHYGANLAPRSRTQNPARTAAKFHDQNLLPRRSALEAQNLIPSLGASTTHRASLLPPATCTRDSVPNHFPGILAAIVLPPAAAGATAVHPACSSNDRVGRSRTPPAAPLPSEMPSTATTPNCL